MVGGGNFFRGATPGEIGRTIQSERNPSTGSSKRRLAVRCDAGAGAWRRPGNGFGAAEMRGGGGRRRAAGGGKAQGNQVSRTDGITAWSPEGRPPRDRNKSGEMMEWNI